jgi:hypothetical protein
MDLLEPQKYPEIHAGPSGPTKRPYDVSGWTLPMQMGVAVDRVDQPFSAALAPAGDIKLEDPVLDLRQNASFLALAEALARGERVRRAKGGKLVRAGEAEFENAAWELRKPRLAIYEPWVANMDVGWTQWVLDSFKVAYTIIHNEDFSKENLRQQFDAIILASQSADSILHGYRNGEATSRGRRTGQSPALQRPEYTGGLGLSGAAALEKFVSAGGTLITFDQSTELPLNLFSVPVRNTLAAGSEDRTGRYYIPGSIIRIRLDSSNPIAYGMPAEAYAFQSRGHAFEIALSPEYNKGNRKVRTVANYAAKDLLASGWVSGEQAVLGRPILVEAGHGEGRIVMFGFRPQFRGQSFGTFKLLLNAIYLASAKTL